MKLELTNIIKDYQGRVVLDIEQLRLESGKKYAVLGPNGSGKTTLLRLISAIERADRGTVHYDDQPGLTCEQIAYLPQKPYIFDTTVLENVTLGIGGGLSGKKAARDLGESALEALHMQNFSRARASSLSGGEAQKIAILRTLIVKKRLVLLDEPTSAVDIPSMKRVEDYISRVVDDNKATLIFSTHNPSQAARMADEIVILWNGRIVEKGPWKRVLYHPRQPETGAFLEYWAGTGMVDSNAHPGEEILSECSK